MCAAVVAQSDHVVYRPIVWDDVENIVEEFDRTWGVAGLGAATSLSRELSRHFVLHYLEPATRGEIAESSDGRFLGVTLARIEGDPALFPQAATQLAAVNEQLNATADGAHWLADTIAWHVLEEDMEAAISINQRAQAELELFLVAEAARGHRVGGTLWRRFQTALRDHGVQRFYLHTDSSCDVGFYDHQGLHCVACRFVHEPARERFLEARKARPHTECADLTGTYADRPGVDDCFIYEGAIAERPVAAEQKGAR